MPRQYIDRPPRIEPELPSGVFNIPNPPDVEEHPGELIAQAFLPMVMVLGYVAMSLFNKGNSIYMMIPMMLSIIASVGLMFYTRMQESKKRKQLAEQYMRRLSELRRKMESEHQQQRIYYYYNYPNPETTLRIVRDLESKPADKQEDIRSGTRLWERRPTDHDFMVLRLGISSRPSTVVYRTSDNENTDSPLTQEAMRLASDSRRIMSVPVTVPIYAPNETTSGPENKQQEDTESTENATQMVRHSIGITGPREVVYSYARTMLVDYATYHSPEDTLLYVVGTAEAEKSWVWAKTLPHSQKPGQKEPCVFERDQPPGDNEPDAMRLFWKEIRTQLERRRMRLQDEKAAAGVKLPFLLMVVDVLDTPPDWSVLKELEGEAAISTILLDGQALGAAIVFLCSSRAKIPSRCTAVIEVERDALERNQAIFRYAETGFDTVRYVGVTQIVPTFEDARDFSLRLAPLEIRRGYGSSLASTVTLLEMLNVSKIEELREMARENWTHSKTPELADWLHTSVGLLSGNEPRVLTFSADADGVHGVIAGSTGSGKSELLMTLIIGLALNYDPSVLNFVLIDFKGGGAFEPFQRLPHKVDIVTNLDQSAVARVFSSINAEMNRRQKINKNTGSKHIVAYRKAGMAMQPESPPYPHLFIIIDEFGEMIANNAEFKAQLESITRLGRALGVSLILAAQKPTGVSDQMRANIKYRICLRVESPEDSREVLRRNDAAFLPPGIPGRGYLQVGNENIELIQTAYTGSDYTGGEDKAALPNVIWVDAAPKKKTVVQKGSEPARLFDVVVEMMSKLAVQESKPQWRPWPEFLPNQKAPRILSLETPLDTAYMDGPDVALLRMNDSEATSVMCLNASARRFRDDGVFWPGIRWGNNAMRPLVGVIDNPYDALQKPLMIDFPSGHAVIFGASGRGKTTFLRTTICSLVLTHSPNELHIYILDFGGRALSGFRNLPHVGAVITSDEDERVQRLIRRLLDIIDQRQKLFNESEPRSNSLDAYNTTHPDVALPAVLVVIDNFAEFREYYDGLMSPLISLVREARAYGMYFLFSADVPGALTNKLYNLVNLRMTLKLADTGEYGNVVGRGVPADLGNTPGRGYIRIGNPLEFQTALAFNPEQADNDDDWAAIGQMVDGRIGQMVNEMNLAWKETDWKGKPPYSIEVLEPRITLEKLMQMAGKPSEGSLSALVGIGDRDLQPLWLDLERQGPHMMVLGQPLSGRTTALRTLLISLAYYYSPDQFMAVLVDLNSKMWIGSEHTLRELPQVVQTVSEINELDLLLANLTNECAFFDRNPRHRKILILIDNYDTFTEDCGRKNAPFLDNMAALVRKYQSLGLWIVIAGSIGITSASEELRKMVAGPSFGLALRTSDVVSRLNGRFPRSLAEVELPMGRAFTVRSGITNMLQIATPYPDDARVPEALDHWVKVICGRWPGKKASWTNPAKAPIVTAPPAPPVKTVPPPASATSSPASTPDVMTDNPYALPPTPPAKPVGQYNLEEIKQKLIEMMGEDLVSTVTEPEALIIWARDMNLLPDEPPPSSKPG